MIERLKEYLRTRSGIETRQLARETEQWLKDDTLNVGLAALRQALIERWLRSAMVEEREKCWYEIHRINAFVKQLRVIVERDATEEVREKRAKAAGPKLGAT